MKDKKIVVFDLDDTLLYEIDFLKSAYQEIAGKLDSLNENLFLNMYKMYQEGENVFDYLVREYPLVSKESLLKMYRNHTPNLKLSVENRRVLEELQALGCILGLITDGRSVTQRNKLKALGITDFFTDIIVSEEFKSMKPALENYTYFHKYGDGAFFYIGDNLKKDFITPNQLGWTTICLRDKGFNIHKQDFNIDEQYLPGFIINDLKDLLSIIIKY